MEQDQGGLVGTREVADLLGVHRATVKRMVDRGELVPVRRIRGAFLFRRTDIEQLVA